MLKTEQLAEMLAATSESTSLDFKGRLDWQDPAHRFEVCRDIAGLANRNGGFLVIGVSELAAGGFGLVGMPTDDPLPDPTDINQVLRERFQPSISCEAAYVDSGGVRFGVIQVPEFDRWPHVCVRDAGANGQPPTLRIGDIYFRSDMISSRQDLGRNSTAGRTAGQQTAGAGAPCRCGTASLRTLPNTPGTEVGAT